MQLRSPPGKSGTPLEGLRDESVPQERVYSRDTEDASRSQAPGSYLRESSREAAERPVADPDSRDPDARALLLSPQDVSRACGLSLKVVYRAIRNGELRASRFGRCLKVRPSELDVWIDRCALRIEREERMSDLPARLAYAAPQGLRTMLANGHAKGAR